MKGKKSSLSRFHIFQLNAAAGFGLAAGFAVFQNWPLPEFCWSAWLAGFVYVWACVLTACAQIIFSARREKAAYIDRFPFLHRLPPAVFLAAIVFAALGASLVAFRVYNFMFAFYGIFLSVFAAMEPVSLFGVHGLSKKVS